ncbi:aldehyde reductase [Streptomyces sp. NBS 14/10]|uniref:SDR family oxidoreductase n=1 Tax=Streptomyces sp. NBS 14/10 TaxID=1945643 RepID=UPI000B7CC1A8|nr:aldehyde reductase [Streptomyces sp. NBS 14/10]KAK1177083.1 aldehyde reductase [Streptomyces sp. NBS 14/10]NUP40347.1 aldehyde reductase [Streptomyces sp.]NUS81955.1 aldehyde reductase [Streptomyces sp.]
MAHVLVTGGTGFLGSHTIAQLLTAGHTVTTTVRSAARRPDVERMLAVAGAPHADGVSYVEADLTSDHGWVRAVEGADYVLHMASPFPGARPKNEDEVIVPARDGALRVLRAARGAGVRRTVLTSSFAAVGYGHGHTGRTFTEDDWTDTEGPGVSAYIKSKTVAERAAWDFVETEGGGLELTVINPVGIFGPVLGPDYSASIRIIHAMLTGAMRAAPPVWTNTVDVRDAADLHLRAMTAPQAAGERYLALAGEPVSFHHIALALRTRLGEAAAKAPTGSAPTWLLRLLATVNPALRETVPQLGVVRRASHAKARKELDWSPRSNEDAVTATAESLMRLGLLSG